jgi:hypothetical protein
MLVANGRLLTSGERFALDELQAFLNAHSGGWVSTVEVWPGFRRPGEPAGITTHRKHQRERVARLASMGCLADFGIEFAAGKVRRVEGGSC